MLSMPMKKIAEEKKWGCDYQRMIIAGFFPPDLKAVSAVKY